MLIGNIASYSFIFVLMSYSSKTNIVRSERLKYIPNKSRFVLLNQCELKIDSATIKIDYDKHNNNLNEHMQPDYHRYELILFFENSCKNDNSMDFELADRQSGCGTTENTATICLDSLHNTYVVVLRQKDPDTAVGWKHAITTDTIMLKKQ